MSARIAAYDPTAAAGSYSARRLHVLADGNRTACGAAAVAFSARPSVERIIAELGHKLCAMCAQATRSSA